MEESVNVRDGLIRMRDETLQSLFSLARKADKREAEKLFGQFKVLATAVENSDQQNDPYPYSRHKSAIVAILVYLDKVGHPVSKKELIDELVKGGWRHGSENVEGNLRRSISAFATGLGLKTKQIKIVNDLVGRGEWDDSRFVER